MKKSKIESKISDYKKKRGPKYYFIESKSSRGTFWGYCKGDSAAVIVSSDEEKAIDYVYALNRGEIQPHDELTVSAHISAEEVEESEILTADAEPI